MESLFAQSKPKKQQLLEWLQKQGRATTSDIMRWGLENFHTRADRDCRELAEENLIWRMSEDAKLRSRWAKSKQQIWSTIPSDKKV